MLEAILFGADATPLDRLRAAELLAELEPRAQDRTFVADVAGLEGDALDRELDASYVADVVRAVLAGKPVLGIDPANFRAETCFGYVEAVDASKCVFQADSA